MSARGRSSLASGGTAWNGHRPAWRRRIADASGEQPAQRAVIGLVQALDARQRIVHRDALVVDFLGVADHPRHRAEAARHPHRTGIGERGKAALEHARIELIGLAVHVHEATREMRAHQRMPRRTPGEQSSTRSSAGRNVARSASRDEKARG
jgi:hypothetical protein